MSHLTFTIWAAMLLAIAFAMLENGSSRDRLYAAARVFISSLFFVLAGGWAMHFLHG